MGKGVDQAAGEFECGHNDQETPKYFWNSAACHAGTTTAIRSAPASMK